MDIPLNTSTIDGAIDVNLVSIVDETGDDDGGTWSEVHMLIFLRLRLESSSIFPKTLYFFVDALGIVHKI